MKQKQKNYCKKSGAITVEVAIGIALAVVVLVVTIGLFSENLSAMVSNSRIVNMFDNTNKSTYDNFNRDYTGAQVNVQLIGEQGLAMLRNLANNKAITQIDKLFDGTDTSITNANSIAYLATVVNSIVGSPNICVYMKKDSRKKCEDDPDIVKTLYNVNISGSSITISKADSKTEVRYPTMGSDYSGGAQGITIAPQNGSPTTANLNPMQSGYSPTNIFYGTIYTYIKNLSFFADDSNTVYDYDILIKKTNAGTPSPTLTTEQVKTTIIALLTGTNGLPSNMQIAHDKCKCGDHWYCGGSVGNNTPGYSSISECGMPLDGYSTSFVDNAEVTSTQDYATTFVNIISGDTSQNVINIINDLINSPDLPAFINLLEQDHINNSCAKFTQALTTFNNPPNNLGINIPSCIPYGFDTNYCVSSGLCSP